MVLLETYGAVQTDPDAVHGSDWAAARGAVERALLRQVPDRWLAERRDEAAALAKRPPAEVLHHGSGWGALELRLRRSGAVDRPATPFPDGSLGPEQALWVELLKSGRFPILDPAAPPSSYQVAPAWADQLERSPAGDWATWLHRGVARHHAGDVTGAVAAWQRSVEAAPNAWALRNQAAVSEDALTAADLLQQAVALAPAQPALLVELMEALLRAHRGAEALSAVDAAPPDTAADPLVRFLEARAAVETGALERAERVLSQVTMPWVREGSRSVDDLWFRLAAARLARDRGVAVDDALLAQVRRESSLPYAYDFRMSPGPPAEAAP